MRVLREGEHFGELALINNEKRSLSIRTQTPCKLLKLDREAFTRILGSIEQQLAKDYNNEFQNRLNRMIDRRRHSQTFDNNFIDLQNILLAGVHGSAGTQIAGKIGELSGAPQSSSNLGSIGKMTNE